MAITLLYIIALFSVSSLLYSIVKLAQFLLTQKVDISLSFFFSFVFLTSFFSEHRRNSVRPAVHCTSIIIDRKRRVHARG